jgi:acetate kinase
MRILVINSGSSSIKYKVFRMPAGRVILGGQIEHIGESGSTIKDHYSGLKRILETIDGVDAVGHRVVHGGEAFKQPVEVTSAVIKRIKQYSWVAPLHNPANLAGISACRRLLPKVKQVAVFDTAFHQSLPAHAFIYGLPYSYYKKYGIRKYGFHGTSHEYVAHEAAKSLGWPLNRLKIITCHLGNGCSISAVKHGRCQDTSMGFSPLEGLVMGTRCGDIDPAAVLYIMHKQGLGTHQMDELLNKHSGLKGISGIGNDMRLIEAGAASGNKRARLARAIFIYRIQKYIGAYCTIMGGCDALVFTAGIGEHQAKIRAEVCRGIFSAFKRRPKVLVIPTNEELLIARRTYQLIHS